MRSGGNNLDYFSESLIILVLPKHEINGGLGPVSPCLCHWKVL